MMREPIATVEIDGFGYTVVMVPEDWTIPPEILGMVFSRSHGGTIVTPAEGIEPEELAEAINSSVED